MDIVIPLLAGVIGLVVGGVINALADDLPTRNTLRPPHYPDGTPRPPSAWLGVLAFITGQRRAPGDSGKSLGWRHPVVEIVTAITFAGMAVRFADEKNLLVWYVIVAFLVLVTVIDIEHRLILFVMMVPACAFALLVAFISPDQGKPASDFLYGGLMGFGVFFVMFLGGMLFSHMMGIDEVAFGFGDVMLATFSGLILGWQAFILATILTVMAGGVGALLFIVARAVVGRFRKFTPIPYGPYIVLATLLMLLFREETKQALWFNLY